MTYIFICFCRFVSSFTFFFLVLESKQNWLLCCLSSATTVIIAVHCICHYTVPSKMAKEKEKHIILSAIHFVFAVVVVLEYFYSDVFSLCVCVCECVCLCRWIFLFIWTELEVEMDFFHSPFVYPPFSCSFLPSFTFPPGIFQFACNTAAACMSFVLCPTNLY